MEVWGGERAHGWDMLTRTEREREENEKMKDFNNRTMGMGGRS